MLQPYLIPTDDMANEAKPFVLVQITDCHLLAEPDSVYQGVKPYQHLKTLLQKLRENPLPLLFTGDLSEDHSAASYQLFADLLNDWPAPVFLLPGNHDERQALAQLCQHAPFMQTDRIVANNWQLWLCDSKGDTPAGAWSDAEQRKLHGFLTSCQQSHVFLFMHHHVLPIGSFIDRFDQQNKAPLLALLHESKVRGLAHGHCHHAYSLQSDDFIQVGCPASSVQFLQTDDWQTIDLGPQACRWHFYADGWFRFDFIKGC